MTQYRVPLQAEWFAQLLPHGWPRGSSTVITGPGGSGKPLVGNVVADAWLRAGGSVLFISLQYPDRHFTYESFYRVTGKRLEEFEDRIAFIDLDPLLRNDDYPVEAMGDVADHGFSANLVYPAVWNAAIARARTLIPASEAGVLVLASALNLLLFSPSWAVQTCETICNTMKDTSLTTLFSISSKPKEELVNRIVTCADNVLFTDKAEDSFKLSLEIRRFGHDAVDGSRVAIPIPEEELTATREIADHSRQRVIPAISAI